METPFLSSNPGRVILVAVAVFLASFAAYTITGSVYPIACGMPVGITIAFVAVGLGMGEYSEPAMFSILVLPPTLWGFFYLTVNVVGGAGSTTFGYITAACAALTLLKAAMGGGEGEATA